MARMGRRRESMPGEFFTIILFEKILTNHVFIAFKCRKAKDRDDNHGGRRRREREEDKTYDEEARTSQTRGQG